MAGDAVIGRRVEYYLADIEDQISLFYVLRFSAA